MAKKLLLAAVFLFLFSFTAFAYNGDISISNSDIRFSPNTILEGNTVRIYATVTNPSQKDLLGVVRFFDGETQINGDQAISIFAGKTDDVFLDWKPQSWGTRTITIRIVPWEPSIDDPNNNSVSEKIYVEQDTDHDGVPNRVDADIDGDGTVNEKDAFPLNPKEWEDTDGDGTGDNADLDDDNDGHPDTEDALPKDPAEWQDFDKDGIGDNADLDDDNDGVLDIDEIELGLDPKNPDTDGDTVNDGQDAFPLDPKEWEDTDGDGIGDNADTDDDNDGILDTLDPFPKDKAPVVDIDHKNLLIDAKTPQTFTSDPSYDEDGKIVSFKWVVNGEEKEGNSITYTFPAPGDYAVSLTAIDDDGQPATKQFQVSVVNLDFYKAVSLSLIAILLALVILFKYILPAKKHDKKHKS
jgi:hypothetical protein